MAECKHDDFEACVAVNRLEDPMHPRRYAADIRIRCKRCGEPFYFIGVDAGLSFQGPRVSIDGLELRVPIRPQGTSRLAASAIFEAPPRES